MSLLDSVHGGIVHDRRTRKLSRLFSDLIPRGAEVLDVGCGDGLLARRIAELRPDVVIRGLDVKIREQTHVAVEQFDGQTFPCADSSYDVVIFADVLHHCPDPLVLLREASRVSRQAVAIKDHTLEGWLAGPTLRFMDWVGNARHGVERTYVYWPRRRWLETFEALGFAVDEWTGELGLYPWPASLVFGRSLHFVARLTRSEELLSSSQRRPQIEQAQRDERRDE